MTLVFPKKQKKCGPETNMNTSRTSFRPSHADSGGSVVVVGLASRSHCLQTIIAWMAIVILTMATAGCSLGQERESASPVAAVERAPMIAIKTAFATLRAPSIDNAAVDRSKAQGFCSDFEFSFVNRACSKMHPKHAAARHHRVATFVVGHPDAIPSSAERPMPSVTVSKESVPSNKVGAGVPQRDVVVNKPSSPNVESESESLRANEHKVRSGRRDDQRIACPQSTTTKHAC
jgi:hypothetical protein